MARSLLARIDEALRTLDASADRYIMPSAWCPVTVTSAAKAPAPWLATQFMTEGKPIVISVK